VSPSLFDRSERAVSRHALTRDGRTGFASNVSTIATADVEDTATSEQQDQQRAAVHQREQHRAPLAGFSLTDGVAVSDGLRYDSDKAKGKTEASII
jgi:hypothetical protein